MWCIRNIVVGQEQIPQLKTRIGQLGLVNFIRCFSPAGRGLLVFVHRFYVVYSSSLPSQGQGCLTLKETLPPSHFKHFCAIKTGTFSTPLPHKHPNLKKKAQTQPTFVTAEVHRCGVLNPAVFWSCWVIAVETPTGYIIHWCYSVCSSESKHVQTVLGSFPGRRLKALAPISWNTYYLILSYLVYNPLI